MPPIETAKLVSAVRRGDRRAFDRLVGLYQTRIYNLALGFVKQEDEAKDLTQDIFVTVLRQIGQLNDINRFQAWLYQLATNHCRNRYSHLRRRGFFSSVSIDDPDTGFELRTDSNPESALEEKNTAELVRAAIDSLNPAEKEIVMLRDIHALSYEEIAEVLAIPIGTVKSKLNRARLALKKRLKHFS